MKNGVLMKQKIDLDMKYMDDFKDLSFQPVFIMGLHRSGTTILYKILGETGKFNIVTLYQILNFERLIYDYKNKDEKEQKEQINKYLEKKEIKTRKTDKITVTADYEQEYVYLFSERELPKKLFDGNKKIFEDLCKKIMYLSKNNKPVLLKNPYDFSNFLNIKQLYPNAKFIFIHRNPLNVISSIMRLWKTRLENKDEFVSLYSKDYVSLYRNPLLLFLMRVYYKSRLPLGVFEIIKNSAKDSNFYIDNIKNLPEKDCISITYEDLCENPNEVITNIMRFLDMKTDQDFSELIKPRKLKSDRQVRFLKKYIYKKMSKYFDSFNYKI